MKVILFANTDWYLYNYRLPLALRLKELGHEVILISPKGKYVERLQQNGFLWHEIRLSRRSINPLQEWRSVRELTRLYKQEQPDLVHHFTIKCILYGSLAARKAGVQKVVNAVTGMGYLFTADNLFTQGAKPLVRALYRRLLRGTQVIFQNSSDEEYFIKHRLVLPEQCTVILSSGVDTQRFKPAPEKVEQGLVVLPARMLWDKGVGEFVEAARLLKQSSVPVRMVLVGDIDPGNPASISKEQLNQWQKEGVVEWWGWQEDMAGVYQRAQVICLPSYYREGLAKSLIEASACGKPLVASDTAGCREVVEEGVNGFLVPAKNVEKLAQAMKKIISNQELSKKMSDKSREIAESRFSVKKINEATLLVYNKINKQGEGKKVEVNGDI